LTRRKNAPTLAKLLRQAVTGNKKPVAFVLAGHNGSGKSTLWNERLSPRLQIPLINADRLTTSILPEWDPEALLLPPWAQALRDEDDRWQMLSQEGVRAFTALVMEQKLPFAFETVFSHWELRADGTRYSSKIDEIKKYAGRWVLRRTALRGPGLGRAFVLPGADAAPDRRARRTAQQSLCAFPTHPSCHWCGQQYRRYDTDV
jgi:hypothetical protein